MSWHAARLRVQVEPCTNAPLASRDTALSGALADVVDRGLANKAADRYQTASAFGDALRRALG